MARPVSAAPGSTRASVTRRLVAGCLLWSGAWLAPAVAHDEFPVTVPSRESVVVPLWLGVPDEPVAVVVLFAGGGGNIGVTGSGIERTNNFLVRSRDLFADAGFVTAVIGLPSDRRNLYGFRRSAKHAADVRAVIEYLRTRYVLPVWLVGTSRGTISVANAAARLSEGGPDGIVLSATVTQVSNSGGDTVYDTRLEDIRVPVLLVHHRDDDCYVTPYHGAVRLKKQLKRAQRVELLSYRGGRDGSSNDCGPRSFHGFFGIEDQVVREIGEWIRRRVGAPG